MTQKIEDFPGWRGSINRSAAEHLLMDCSVGSYLLRNADLVSQETVSELSTSNTTPIQCYLCTVLESQDRIVDLLILETPLGWTIYQDNPDLSDSEYVYFPSLFNLLTHLHKKARHPIK